jgi:alcohol dehydrogenase class IV
VINDFSLIPQYAVLDYANTINLPPFITATTGMDAFTHAIEAYIGNSRTFETKKMSIVASKLIVKNLKKVYKNPRDFEARNNMIYASYYAGVAFTKAYVGYVHAIAHTLGGKYNIPHGLANAIILPIVLEEYGESIYRKVKKIAFESLIVSYKDSEEEATKKFINWIYNTNKELNIPKYIKEIKEEDIDELVDLAIKEANPLYPVPKIFNKEDLKRIYLRIRGN